ncbi:hypothetical protein HLRTI_002713 [Halorhabdus tiamatea SARL4B]|uniref:Uncharacterized protein n=1 Tax=Halorhabdus tiamatea SARL4B TaxID=1033806 RepID=U2DZQ7_9EURY|nr:hypothetical protein [Halorhabdus tiamatea]ERJ05271.1 hypothetical protein HLRTI_002713 [Halorhabdus tiamatea SARL4B]
MNRYLVVAKAITTKSVTLSRRYAVNTAINFLTLYVFFALVFFGGRFIAPALLEQSLGPLVVGYFLVTMAVAAYADLTHDLTDEAQWGTLEQLSMSPIGFTWVVVIKTVVNLAGTFLMGVVLLALMIVTTGVSLSIPPLTIAVVGGLTLVPVVGLGFLFGGGALLFNQLGKVFSLVQLSFFGLLALPVQDVPALKFLPLALGSHLLREVTVDRVALWDLPLVDMGILGLTATAYATLGLIVFRFAASKARERGELGHY